MSGGFFVARYPGRCGACEDLIERGDTLTYDEDDSVVHLECTMKYNAKAVKPTQTCPRCFLTVPVSGECGCNQ